MEDLLYAFKEYCLQRGSNVDQYTSEFTLQFRLSRFLEENIPDVEIELESNIERYDLRNLTKKEIDINLFVKHKKREVIEIKYVRDPGTFNIGMFRYCEDNRFIEELCESPHFTGGFAILFTNIPQLYTKPNRPLNPKNKENLRLYQCFRLNRELSGLLQTKLPSAKDRWV